MQKKKNFKITPVIMVVFILFFAVVLGGIEAESVYVTVDGSIQYQTINGWGIRHYLSWDWEGPERYPISEQDVMYQIKELGMDEYVDNMDNDLLGRGHERTNDDNDPFHYNWDSYNSQLASMERVFQRLQYQQNAGLKYGIGSVSKPAWMYDASGHFNSSKPNMYEEFAEFWASLLIYARDNYGLDFSYIILQNEPTWSLRASSWLGFTPIQLRNAIKAVGKRLREEGFDTMIIAPDDYQAAATRVICQTVLSDPNAKKYMNCIAFHPYDNDSGRDGPDKAISALKSLAEDGVIKKSGLPLWQTEWSLAWAYGDRMRDWVDTLKLALDFAKMVYNCHVYGNTSLFVVWSSEYDWDSDRDGNGFIENEGIFGPGVIDGKLSLKKYGHVLSNYTKYVSPGSKRIEAHLTGASNTYVTAYINVLSGAFTLVFINKSTNSCAINVNIKNIQSLSALNVVQTSSKHNSADLGQVSATGNSFTYTLPSESVTTFTTISTDDLKKTKKAKIRR